VRGGDQYRRGEPRRRRSERVEETRAARGAMGTGDARREIKRGVGRKSWELYAIVRTDAIGGWNLAFGAREEQSSSAAPPPRVPSTTQSWHHARFGSGRAAWRSDPAPAPATAAATARRRGEPAAGCWLLLLSARPRAGGVVSRGRGAGGNGGTVAWSLEQRTVGAVAAQSILTP
jgi:hypothetical protein